MFRLRHVVVLMTNAVITGGLLIFVFAMGWYGWAPVIGAAILGFALSWPAARLVARKIKRDDPAWNEDRERPASVELEQRRARAQDRHEPARARPTA